MTYEHILELSSELGVHKSHKFIRTKNNGQYLKLTLNATGWCPKLSKLLSLVEMEVGKDRTFSHNPVNGVACFTIYDTK